MPYLLGASEPTTTVTTPSSASAREASMFLITACGYGECRILPISIPGTERSSVYFPCPVVLPAESTSAILLPMTENSLIAWSLPCRYSSLPEIQSHLRTILYERQTELHFLSGD